MLKKDFEKIMRESYDEFQVELVKQGSIATEDLLHIIKNRSDKFFEEEKVELKKRFKKAMKEDEDKIQAIVDEVTSL